MKKVQLTTTVSLIFLCTSSCVAYYLRYVDFIKSWLPLLIGAGVTLVSFIIYICIKKFKTTSYITLFISAIGLGFCIRAWYMFRGFDNTILTMIVVSIVTVSILWVFYLLLYIPFFEKKCGVYTIFFVVISFITYFLVMLFTETTYVSTFGYYMIVELAFIIAMCLKTNNFKKFMDSMALASFSVLIVAIIIGLIMLSGDGSFDFDFGDDGIRLESPKNKKINL